LKRDITFESVLMRFAKNYQNWEVLVETTACQSWLVFFETRVDTIVTDTTLYVLYGIRHNHNLVSVSDGGIVMVAMMMMIIN